MPWRVKTLQPITDLFNHLIFRAIKYLDTGTKEDRTKIDFYDLEYFLYYAKIGTMWNNITINEFTSAADVMKAVGTITHSINENVGILDEYKNILKDDISLIFKASNLTSGVQYRYTIITIHKCHTNITMHKCHTKINSKPTVAKTVGIN